MRDESPYAAMLAAVRTDARRAEAATGDPVLGAVVALIDRLGAPTAVEPRTLPVVDEWLDAAIDLATDSTQLVAEVLASHHGLIHWCIPYGDVSGDPDIEFMRTRYAYGLLAGSVAEPTVPWSTTDLLLGFVVQGPDVMYPAHRHPAVEAYSVIGGTARWRRGDEGWIERPPGSVFIHDANMIHATNTLDEPTVSWVAWTTDADCDPELVPGA